MDRRRWRSPAARRFDRWCPQVDCQAIDGEEDDFDTREEGDGWRNAQVAGAQTGGETHGGEGLDGCSQACTHGRPAQDDDASGGTEEAGRRNDRRQSLSCAILELEAREPRIKAATPAEVGVRAFFDDTSTVHHHDAVGGAHGGEAVRDDDGGAVLH